MKKYILVIILIIISLGLAWIYHSRQPQTIKINVPEAKEHQEFVDKNIDIDSVIKDIIEEEVVTEKIIDLEEEVEIVVVEEKINSINLAVPFTSQAPTANWNQPFQDSCEEAAVLMVVYYYQNKNMPSKEAVEDILVAMIDWQTDFMNGTYDITIAEVGEFTKGFFDYNTKLITDLTATKIRDLLREGIPVIVPANGHILNNPNFRGDGPDYHMLVIKGFIDDPFRPGDSEASKFITNDPGTRNGADFVYSEANLMEAIADWDKEKALTIGPKTGLILLVD